MSGRYEIRQMRVEDVPAVAEILRAVYHHDDPDEVSEEYIAAKLTEFDVLSFVQTSLRNRIVGFILVERMRKNFKLEQLAIHPNYQRRGFATALMARMLQQATDMHDTAMQNGGDPFNIYLYVPQENFGARSLYERFGFETYGPPKHSATYNCVVIKMIKTFQN